MRIHHWICMGVGINTDSIRKYLDVQKCVKLLREQFPEEDINEEDFDIDDYLYVNLFGNLGEMLCCCDDTDTLTYGNNGDGEYFFFYVPSYPWERRNNEPENIEEVHNRIIAAVQKICLVTSDEVEKIICDDIYEYGCG